VAVGLLRWLERRTDEQAAPDSTHPLLTVGIILAAAAALHWLVNHFAPVQIHSYGTMLIVALAAGIWWLSISGRPHGIPGIQWLDFALLILIGAVIGARVVFVILNWDQYAAAPVTIFSVWEGGLSFHGGLGGAIIAGYLFSRVRGMEFNLVADLATPATALGYSLTRIGCFLNGCCYGRACSSHWPLGMVFPPGTAAGQAQVPIHPTQLYASFASIIIFYILVRVQPHIKARGNLFLFYLVLYSIYRFMVEFYRRGASAKVFESLAPLTEAQTASIVIGVVALVWMLVRRASALKEDEIIC